MVGQGFGSTLPEAKNAESHTSTRCLGEKVGKHVKQYLDAMENVMTFAPPHLFLNLLLLCFIRNF